MERQMNGLRREMARLNMAQELEILDDWFDLSPQDKAVTIALIKRLAAEQRARRPAEPRLRLVVAAG